MSNYGYRQALGTRLKMVADDIDRQIDVLEEDGKSSRDSIFEDVPARRRMDANGNYLMTPLLVAKAQVLAALVELEKLND